MNPNSSCLQVFYKQITNLTPSLPEINFQVICMNNTIYFLLCAHMHVYIPSLLLLSYIWEYNIRAQKF